MGVGPVMQGWITRPQNVSVGAAEGVKLSVHSEKEVDVNTHRHCVPQSQQ